MRTRWIVLCGLGAYGYEAALDDLEMYNEEDTTDDEQDDREVNDDRMQLGHGAWSIVPPP